jgi:hypothetical protein
VAIGEKDELDHAWRYFQLHATQRITVFNFYVAASGLVIAGLIYSLRGGEETALYSVIAGIALFLLSFVFSKMDKRVKEMIKSSEKTISRIEASSIEEPKHRVMTMEQEEEAATRYSLFGNWTYGQSFRRIFWVGGAFGLIGSALGAWQVWTPQTIKTVAIEQPQSTPSLPEPEAGGADEVSPGDAEPIANPVAAEDN